MSEVQNGTINEASHQLSYLGNYAVFFVYVKVFMEDLGLLIKYRLSVMDSGNRDTLLKLSAATILGLVYEISAVVEEKNEYN